MAFRYINPGYTELLDSDCVTTAITGTEYSKTGVAFTQTNSSAGVTITDFAEGDDFWARFDVYLPNEYHLIRLLFPCIASAGVSLSFSGRNTTTFSLSCSFTGSWASMVSYPSWADYGIQFEAINTFSVHGVYGSPGLIEIFIGDKTHSKTGNLVFSTNYTPTAKLYASSSDKVYFSNIIFSNTKISPKEQVIALPTSETVTDMTAGESGIYIADTVNQTLLQTVDVSTLIENYGASSAVTGIAVVGNPAYKTATGLASLIGIEKSGGASIVEHGTCDLSDDTEAGISTSWSTDNLTIADLQNMQFGWKAGE